MFFMTDPFEQLKASVKNGKEDPAIKKLRKELDTPEAKEKIAEYRTEIQKI